jgi:phosphatidylglycerophosphate synthase
MQMSTHELRLDVWSRRHAGAMIAASAAAIGLGGTWPVVSIAFVTFGALLWHASGAWTPDGRFGWGNAITALRLALIITSGLALHGAPGHLLAGVVLGVFALDAFDGWLARRTESTSVFGALFDMETDALLVLVLSLELWQSSRLGAWVLTAGLLRYAYVMWLAAMPGNPPPQPRSRFARYAFAALVVGLVLALILEHPFGTYAAAIGTAAVSVSFLRSFAWSWLNGLPASSDPRPEP